MLYLKAEGQKNFVVLSSNRDINLPSLWYIKSISGIVLGICTYVTLYAKIGLELYAKNPDMGVLWVSGPNVVNKEGPYMREAEGSQSLEDKIRYNFKSKWKENTWTVGIV